MDQSRRAFAIQVAGLAITRHLKARNHRVLPRCASVRCHLTRYEIPVHHPPVLGQHAFECGFKWR